MKKKPSEIFEDNRTCVQCGRPMTFGFNDLLRICDDPKCPNYGLLQLGIEKMKEIKDKYE